MVVRSSTPPAPSRLQSVTPAKRFGQSHSALNSSRSATMQQPPWQSNRSKPPSVQTGRSPAAATQRREHPQPQQWLRPTQSATPARTIPTSSSFSSASTGPGAVRNDADVSTAAPDALGQFKLFTQLQAVVVQLSQCAVSEKHKFSHMQKRLDAYAQLVREQDRMIEELKALNSRLIKEKEALLSFRRDEDDGPEEAPPMMLAGDGGGGASGNTPKSKEFVQSLVSQLRDEKRQRLAVEEQSSRMIGEQQLTIHRLEEKLKNPQGGHVSPHRSSHGTRQALTHSPVASRYIEHPASGAQNAKPVPMMQLQQLQYQQQQQQQQSVAMAAPSAVPSTAPLPAAVSRSSSVSVPVGAGSAVSMPAAHVAPSPAISATSMEDASLILQEIRRRHGL